MRSDAGPSVDVATLRVYVVDEHPVFCEGLARVLAQEGGLELVGVAHAGTQALRELHRESVDLVLVDEDLTAGISGARLCATLTGEPYRLTCLTLMRSSDGASVRASLASGARGVLLKRSGGARIVEAIRTVARGGTYLDPALSEAIAGSLTRGRSDLPGRLTPTERVVLRHLAEGLSNREISGLLSVSTSSVKGYVSHVLDKVGVSSRTEAVAVAARTGLLELLPDVRAHP